MSDSNSWDKEVDLVVVGFGCAGVSAAIDAADNGASVLIVERFNGGGATKASGGVVYSGGGTSYQKSAGSDDTPENMFNYLKMETKGVVADSTLRAFCDQSNDNLEWLAGHGVPFEPSLCPYKTSYPTNKYFLYYSGNESFAPFNKNAKPAPRGHRVKGKGISGVTLFFPLKEAALRKGVEVTCQSIAKRLITDDDGNVIGLEYSSIPKGSIANIRHRLMSYLAYKMRYGMLGYPPMIKKFKNIFRKLEKKTKTHRVRARKGVVLSTGGFVFNRDMLKEYAPAYKGGAPLGSLGDDGSGIRMGMDVGGAVDHMERISAWRFINPPEAFVKGVLVDRKGERLCNEMYYGAQTAEIMVDKHRDEGILIIDSKLWRRAHFDLRPGRSKIFQTGPALINLYYNNRKSKSIEGLAKACKIDSDGRKSTIDAYNRVAESGSEDPMGKPKGFLQKLTPPFYAINCSVGAKGFACPIISLGGLVVDEESGVVKREDGTLIEGLYAAGRTAVGVTSRGYVSGLSLADAVFSGRRAGRHASSKN